MKNKVVILSIITLLIFTTLPLSSHVVSESNDAFKDYVSRNEYVMSFNFSPPNIFHDDKYIVVTMEKSSYHVLKDGFMHLPVFTKTVIYPIETQISKITYTAKHVQSFNLKNNFMNNVSMENTETQCSNHWMCKHITAGLYKNERVIFLTLELFPVYYKETTNELLYTPQVDVYINAKTMPITSYIKNHVDLLIISPNVFQDELQPLVKHKEDNGVSTLLKTTEHIYSHYDGRDKQERIKYCIRDAIETYDIKYVLLVGGMNHQRWWSWHVPVRYSNLAGNYGWENSYISDLYYADIYKYDDGKLLFDDWDSNDNGIFAEWTPYNRDILDMYPDVYLGRLPCRKEKEVVVMVNKIITYENTIYNQSWFNSIVAIGGDTHNDNVTEIGTDYIEGQIVCDKALSYMDDFEKIRLYVEDGNYLFAPNTAEEVLSQGHGFVYFSGHGFPNHYFTFPHNDFNTRIQFNLKNIRNLNNGNKLPILVVGGCHLCQFNVSMLHLLKIWEGAEWLDYITWKEFSPISWGWLFTRHEKGGAIATIGSTGLDYETVGDGPVDEVPSVPDGVPDVIQYFGGWLDPHFFEVYANGTTNLGEIQSIAIADYLNKFPIDWNQEWQDEKPYSNERMDCKTIQEWTLFGDPSLKIGGYKNS